MLERNLHILLREFGERLTPSEYNQYMPKLRDYFVPYMMEEFDVNGDIDSIFSHLFTKKNVIQSSIFYVKENNNVKSATAVNDFLIALNRFFVELVFDKYSNPTLLSSTPFSSLKVDVNKSVKKIGIQLNEKSSEPAINDDHAKFIIKKIKELDIEDEKELQIKIMFKLFLLYGVRLSKVSKIKTEDFNDERRILKIKYSENSERNISIELPYNLYIDIRKLLDKRSIDGLLFLKNTGSKIDQSYFDNYFKQLKKDMLDESINCDKLNITGMIKYSIIQMILSDVNQDIIKDMTGVDIDIIDYCNEQVLINKGINRNNYVNSKIRGIPTYELMSSNQE